MSNEPLVLIPPMLCDARVFAPQFEDLSLDTPVMFAPTSTGERIEEIASNILGAAPAKFALAGMSMGGAVALEMLRRQPDRITRIALISASAQGETPQAASAREPLIVAARSGRFGDVIHQEMNPNWLAEGPERVRITNLITSMGQAVSAEGYVRQARAMQKRKDQQSTLRNVKQPTLVVCGAEDSLLPPRRHEFLAELVPYAKLEIIPGAGHLPTLEQPELTNHVLRTWMRQPLVLR
ncbi:Pimeloyl-ACP methyl ester carboxylesterase [Cognatiyoonia koreensis]|uniref:Pimeloyl-ACP methyl ester carboxylesterase n=1 Tax=Cognatiyoonia koreensis TaxID=364200 RepID=A0A1I0Q799_9RHOB|nr:alpha/beta fold hydrolase [Cognatiyoonia koreensis]SEW22851.1 Pimeloyl-ACP methyl ester carboxylesterase [Cognatiyoonia koreensis]